MKRSIYLALMIFAALFVRSQEMTDSHINKSDREGRRQGLWKVYDEVGNLKYTGDYLDGKPIGTFTYYYPEGEVKALVRHSEGGGAAYVKNYHRNGKLMAEGKYTDQKKDSTWLYYNESDGSLSLEEYYQNTVKEGVWKTFYPEGQVAEEVIYIHDRKDGPWTQYFTDGKVKLKAAYVNDQIEGQYIVYHLNGMVEVSGFFQNSFKNGTWVYFNDKGDMEKREEYQSGKLISQIVYDIEQ